MRPNSKGQIGEQAMFAFFIFLCFIIAVGLFTGVSIYFGGEYDFRPLEASMLSYSIKECMLTKNIDFNVKDAEGLSTELFSKCSLDKTVIRNYYIVQIKDENNILFGFGNPVLCDLKGGANNPGFPKCTADKVTINGKSIDILVGSKQQSRSLGT